MATNEPNKLGTYEVNVLQNKSVSALNISQTKPEIVPVITTHSHEFERQELSELDEDSSGRKSTTIEVAATQSTSLIVGVVLVGVFVSIMIGVMVYRLFLLNKM